MRTRATARYVPPPPVLLEAQGYPHIIDRIIDLTPGEGLLGWRGTSKANRDRADAALLRHLIVSKEGEKMVVRSQDGQRLPRRRWPKTTRDQVRILDFVHVQSESLHLIPEWVTGLESVSTVLWAGTAYIGPPVPTCTTFVTTQTPFRIYEGDAFALRTGGRLVILVQDKRVDADIPEFIREYASESFSLVLVFQKPDSRNRRPGDVLIRMLRQLGALLARPDSAMSFVFVNTEAWIGQQMAPDQLKPAMRAAAGDDAEDRLDRVKFLSLDEYAESVGVAQFESEMQLGGRGAESLPEA